MDKFKSIFNYKKGSLGLGSSREKKEYLQAMAFLYIASCGILLYATYRAAHTTQGIH